MFVFKEFENDLTYHPENYISTMAEYYKQLKTIKYYKKYVKHSI